MAMRSRGPRVAHEVQKTKGGLLGPEDQGWPMRSRRPRVAHEVQRTKGGP